jgi:hypothetical protein
MCDEIEIEIDADVSDSDWQAIKAIAETGQIEGIVHPWIIEKISKIYLGYPLAEVFPRVARARQKDHTAETTAEIVTRYAELRSQTKETHQNIRSQIASEMALGEETIKKAWDAWGKFF